MTNHIVLKLIGYYSYKDPIDEPLLIDYENIEYQTQKNKSNKLKYLYNIFVLGLISWTVIYDIILTIKNAEIKYLLRSTFNIMLILQYIYGIKYFRKNNNILDNRLNRLFNISIWLSLIFSIMNAIVSVILVISKYEINVYSEIYGSVNIPILIVLFFDKLYNYTSFLINSSIFVICILNHQRIINNYSNKIVEYSESSYELPNKINTIITEMSVIKEDYCNSVSNLNAFFVVLNIFGFIYFYINIISYNYHSMLHYDQTVNIILFIIIEFVFIISSLNIRRKIDDIITVIRSPVYINNFIRTSLDVPQTINLSNNVILIWNLLLDLLTTNWKTFEIFGFKLDDTQILQKIFGLAITFLLTNEIAKFLSNFV